MLQFAFKCLSVIIYAKILKALIIPQSNLTKRMRLKNITLILLIIDGMFEECIEPKEMVLKIPFNIKRVKISSDKNLR